MGKEYLFTEVSDQSFGYAGKIDTFTRERTIYMDQ